MKISKSLIKDLSKLNLKKYRELEDKFIIEGKKIVNEALNSDWKIEYLLILDENQNDEQTTQLVQIARDKGIMCFLLDDKDFRKISDTISSQGIAAIVRKKNVELNYKNFEYNKASLIVALDKISDPGNLGTIIRICDWFGVDHVLISENSADLYNPKVLRSTMGSIFHLNIKNNLNLKDSITQLKNSGYTIFATTLKGIKLSEIKFNSKSAIIFGSEARGISDDLVSLSEYQITIPKYGKAESLNVASASSIILSDFKNKTNVMEKI